MAEPTAIRVPIRVRLGLRWADTDQYGHINNVALVRLTEEARIRALGLPDKREQFPAGSRPALADLGTATFTMVVAQRLEYVAEAPYAGQDIVADVWLSRLGTRSLDMDCRIQDEPGGITYALARVALVIMDLATRIPRALTGAEIDRLSGFLAEPLAFRKGKDTS